MIHLDAFVQGCGTLLKQHFQLLGLGPELELALHGQLTTLPRQAGIVQQVAGLLPLVKAAAPKAQQAATKVGLQAAEVHGPCSPMGNGRKVTRRPLEVGVEVESRAAQVEPAGHGSSRQTGRGRKVPRTQAAVVEEEVVQAIQEVGQVLHPASITTAQRQVLVEGVGEVAEEVGQLLHPASTIRLVTLAAVHQYLAPPRAPPRQGTSTRS